MKILLTTHINHPLTYRKFIQPPFNDIGLGYIASSCKKAGADVSLLDWKENMNVGLFRKKLLELKPDIVGIKAFTLFFKQTYETLKVVKDVLPDAITIIGGPHPSVSKPEDLFIEYEGILDYAISGDGEMGILELVKLIQIAHGKPASEKLKNVTGLIYRDGNDVKANPAFFPELGDLTELDWSLQPPYMYRNVFNAKDSQNGNFALVLDSRGCPANCGHCTSYIINGPKPRKKNLDTLCNEIEELVNKYNVTSIEFTGNSFLSDVDYLKQLCEWLIKLEKPLTWGSTGAAFVSRLNDSKLLNLMKSAGCTKIHYGIESGNPRIRKLECKPESLSELVEVINLTVKVGIQAIIGMMFGFVDETGKEMSDTIKFAYSLPSKTAPSFTICMPFPGTTSYKVLLNQRNINRIDWHSYDFLNPMLPCKASLSLVKYKLFKANVLRRSGTARKMYQTVLALRH